MGWVGYLKGRGERGQGKVMYDHVPRRGMIRKGGATEYTRVLRLRASVPRRRARTFHKVHTAVVAFASLGARGEESGAHHGHDGMHAPSRSQRGGGAH
ncbi:hypothetical protein FGB62_66g148 [Gracilaria domingensis]|nr:hypothetical protein FGB62_66g148 [Gracilaria domingensis]